MPPVAGIAASVLAPHVGALVGSIAGDIGGKIIGGLADPSRLGGAGSKGITDILGGITQAFEKLFEQKPPQRPHTCPPRPLPFSPAPGFPLGNPLGVLKDMAGVFNGILPELQKLLGAFQGNLGNSGPTPATAGGVSVGRPPSVSAGGGSVASQALAGAGNVDSLMAQANQILADPNATEADKAKAQKLMQDAANLFQMISALIKMVAEMLRTAIQAFSR